MIDIDYEAVGARIAAFRKQQGLTAADLARKVGGGLSREVLAKIETGNRTTLDVRTIASIALALQVPLITLLLDVENPDSHVDVGGEPRSVLHLLSWLQGWRKDPTDWTGPRTPELTLRALERFDGTLMRVRIISEAIPTAEPEKVAELRRNHENAAERLADDVEFLHQLGVKVNVIE